MYWKRAPLFIIATLSALIAAPVMADDRAEIVLFSSAEVDASTGIKVTQYFVADDFQIGFSTSATSAGFILGDWNGDFPSVFDGLIRWEIRLNDAGLPGGLVAHGTAYDVGYNAFSPPGGSVYTTTYHVYFNLGQMIQLDSAFLYWLVLNVNQGLAYDQHHSWVKAESVNSNTACFHDGSLAWTQSPIDLTFSLTANTTALYLFADGFEGSNTNIWSDSSGGM